MPATSKRLHLTRHAQAEHNVASDYTIRDAPLTQLGREQSRELNELTKDTYQKTAELLVSSPLRRPMSTFIVGYPELRARLESQGKPVILLATLQEVNNAPCDTGSPTSLLAKDPEYAGLDFSSIPDDWTSKKGIYDPRNVAERAKQVRQWLRARQENEIVVVAHGDILRAICAGTTDSYLEWNNAESKLYTFKSEDDDEAALVAIKDEEVVAGGADEGSSGRP